MNVLLHTREFPTMREKHFALIDACNDATTREDYHTACWILSAWRHGMRDAGHPIGMMDADWHTGARIGFPDLGEGCPDMCCGVRPWCDIEAELIARKAVTP